MLNKTPADQQGIFRPNGLLQNCSKGLRKIAWNFRTPENTLKFLNSEVSNIKKFW